AGAAGAACRGRPHRSRRRGGTAPRSRIASAHSRVRSRGRERPTRVTELRHSPLDAQHRALGARMVPFGGWDMPLQYDSVLEEHRACRTHAVVFDVSHLGTVECGGPGAFELLQWLLTNDLRKIETGRAQYTPPL